MILHPMLARMRHGLIVSCQAKPQEPLHGAAFMTAMACAAAAGGAVGIRANGPEDIAAIKASVNLPIIGLYKATLPNSQIRITPTLAHACQVADAGADLIALDATNRLRPDGLSAADLIIQVRSITGHPVVADVSTLDEGLAAVDAGAEAIATTLSGYTNPSSTIPTEPDLDLVAQLVTTVKVPVIAEGRIVTPEQAACALEFGAYAVVVGGAITQPQAITARFVAALRGFS